MGRNNGEAIILSTVITGFIFSNVSMDQVINDMFGFGGYPLVCYALIASIFGTFGDLLESKLKRKVV
jgi:CDP-diglyceride synthetase